MLDAGAVITADFREMPWWWEALPDDASPGYEAPLPQRADVLIVGAGLTGVAAAHDLACAGREVLVLDAGEPGQGASSRNHGMLGRNFKHPFAGLIARLGLAAAIGWYRELDEVYAATVARIETEGLDCGFRRCGRFIGALSPRHYESLAYEYELRARHLGAEVEILPAIRQREIGSARYHGGVLIHDNAALHPGLYMRAMLRRAQAAGARIVGRVAVQAIRRDGTGLTVLTEQGTVHARETIVATNGLTPPAFDWFAQRLVPIHAYTAMTEKLPAELARRLLPGHRTYHDNRRRSNPFLLAPDGSNRLLFSSRNGALPPRRMRDRAAALHRDMLFFFPELAGIRFTHAWAGRCAATWDLLPHAGVQDGIHYALGYCFSGNAMAPYLGSQIAARLLGRETAPSHFMMAGFPKVPLLARSRHFMPLLATYYSLADRPAARREPASAPTSGLRIPR
ncbi:NAD(P)/FAD-dependent oxidoreductase [Elioraea sp.]|uniref:NAD(P)/FAD-dependent oxidoreductase n=1 Tax=Elioraea sp. TaxID=2185103 RepID=UPI003F71EE7A